jgi:hypothetical protein
VSFIGRKLSRWTPLFIGLVCGLIASTSLVYAWNRPYDHEDALYLLGSGKGLSALVTVGGTRVLIASGNDPIAFANALAGARPLTAPRIDLLIVAPHSERVAARAEEITKPSMMLEIAPADDVPNESDKHLIRSRETIELGNEMTLTLDPGITIGSPIAGWSIAIQHRGLEILLVERLPVRPLADASMIAVMGEEFSIPSDSPAAIISASSAVVAGTESNAPYPLGLIDPGDIARLPIGDDSITLPGSWKPD